MAANRINRIAKHMFAPIPPRQPQTVMSMIPPGFAICPPQIATAQSWQQEIYRQAYEQAVAAVQVPRHHRLLFSVWN